MTGSTSNTAKVVFYLIVLACVVGCILWLLWPHLVPFHPHQPLISLSAATFNLSSLSPTHHHHDDHNVSSDLDFTLSLQNPNDKLDVSYHDTSFSVYCGPYLVVNGAAHLFSLDLRKGKNSSGSVRVSMCGVWEKVRAEVGREIAAEAATGEGMLTFSLRVRSRVTFVREWSDWPWRYSRRKTRSVRLSCGDVEISFGNGTSLGGSMVGPPSPCVECS